jgi:hypothetical protein
VKMSSVVRAPVSVRCRVLSRPSMGPFIVPPCRWEVAAGAR